MLAPLGMPVLDASHPAVATASLPLLRDAVARAPDIERALAGRSAELRGAGFEPQVEDMAGLTLVFGRENAIKRRLTVGERPTGRMVLTPNVLLRPIVEHAILPTVGYWAGPGELAYFAQASAVASAMERPLPLAVPRWSCMLLEPHVETVLQRLGLQPDDLETPHAAERRLAREAMDPRTAAGIAALRADVAALGERLGPEPRELGLDAVVTGAIGALQHRVDRLERRLLAGIARRESGKMRDLGTVRGALYPFGGRQERTLNLVPTLARHGLVGGTSASVSGARTEAAIACCAAAACSARPARPSSQPGGACPAHWRYRWGSSTAAHTAAACSSGASAEAIGP
jgi:hypothetical protein